MLLLMTVKFKMWDKECCGALIDNRNNPPIKKVI